MKVQLKLFFYVVVGGGGGGGGSGFCCVLCDVFRVLTVCVHS